MRGVEKEGEESLTSLLLPLVGKRRLSFDLDSERKV